MENHIFSTHFSTVCGKVTEKRECHLEKLLISCGNAVSFPQWGSAALDLLDHFLDLGAVHAVLLHLLFHLEDGGHDRSMIAVDDLADVGQGHIGNGSDDVDRDVAGVGDLLFENGKTQHENAEIFIELVTKKWL